MGRARKPENGSQEILGQLIDYIDGRMSKEESKKIAAKIAQDKDLQQLEKVVRDLRQEALEIDWSGIRGSVHSLLETQLRQVKPGKGSPDARQGITIFDSKLLPLPEGVRPATVDTRRVKFSVGEALVEIALYPISPNSYEIIGQLSGFDTAHDLTVEMRRERTCLKGQVNQFGLFRYPRVSDGIYRIIVKDGRQVVARMDLEI
jgi:hypothetical protein